jgi:histidinol-phosphatase (PHP family)
VAGSLDGVAIEVSSAGLHKPHGKLYPSPAFLTAARRRGLPITLASDAHIPQNVGRDLDRAIEHAQSFGYETVTLFDRRESRQEPLG